MVTNRAGKRRTDKKKKRKEYASLKKRRCCLLKKTKAKQTTSVNEEKETIPQEVQNPVVQESKPPSPDSIFSSDKIDKLFNAVDPINKYFITRSFQESQRKCEFRRRKIKGRGRISYKQFNFFETEFFF